MVGFATMLRGPSRCGSSVLVWWAVSAHLLLPAFTTWHVVHDHTVRCVAAGVPQVSASPRRPGGERDRSTLPPDDDACPTCQTLAQSRVTPSAPIDAAPVFTMASWTWALTFEASPIRATPQTPRSTRGPPAAA